MSAVSFLPRAPAPDIGEHQESGRFWTFLAINERKYVENTLTRENWNMPGRKDKDKQTKREPRLYGAARLVLAERDALADSAPRGVLFRLEVIARELRAIEDRL
jgi:hypothetical protein